MKTELFDYQQDAVSKLKPTRIGALLADMGTGKTRMTLELIKKRFHKIDRTIWFTPASLRDSLLMDINKHCDYPVEKYDQKNGMFNGILIVSIESMASSDKTIFDMKESITDKTFVIVDESSFIKNPFSKRCRRITNFSRNCQYRLILSGTSVSQGVVDLYSQFYFLSPKILGYNSFHSFAANHLEYSDKYPGMIIHSHNTKHIAAKIGPYTYQIKKEECLELKGKNFSKSHYSLSSKQREYYEQAKEEILFDTHIEEFESFTIFRLFTALQQIVSGYWHRKVFDDYGKLITDETIIIEEPEENERIKILMTQIETLPENENLIIWGKFKFDIESIFKTLSKKYGPESISLYYGDVKESDKKISLERFLEGKTRFFLATQSCGGYGLNLVNCSRTTFYNRSFKLSERNQAEDRVYRIGQDKACFYDDILASDCIDTRIMNSLEGKENFVKEFIEEMKKLKKAKNKAGLKNLIKKL